MIKQKIILITSNYTNVFRIMAVVVLSLIAGSGMSYAKATYSQSTLLTLDLNNKSIKEILIEIEKNSEFVFFYYDEAIDANRKVTLNVKDQTIDKVLDRLFKSTDNTYIISDRQVFISQAAPAAGKPVAVSGSQQQMMTVTGTVVDEAGEPLIGVNIQISGTTVGTISDMNGQFTLQGVAARATLTVSYIGYITQQIPIGNTSNLRITMKEDSQSLEEVVVVGYGTQRKATLTGAVAAISSDEIMTTKSDNVINTMQGKVAGVLVRQGTGEPGKYDSDISIRGFGDPLFVIDGVIRSKGGKTEFARLNAEDIESVSFLKDASAAIYGMNSGNGVVVVTTKKGTSGRARVSYSGLFSQLMPTGMPQMTSSYEDRLLKNEYRRNAGQQPAFTEEDLEHYRNGDEGYPDFDWLDAYLRKVTPSQSHTLSVRGGDDKNSYYASLGYRRDEGFIKNGIMYSNQYTLRANYSSQLSRDLKMNVRFSGRIDQNQNGVEPWIWTYKSLIVNDRGVEPYTLGNNGHLSDVPPEGKNPAALIDPDLEGFNRPENTTINTMIDFTYSRNSSPA